MGSLREDVQLTVLLASCQTIGHNLLSSDIQEAFEKAQGGITLQEIFKIGIRSKLLGWITEHFTNTKAKVIFQESTSGSMNLEQGIPHGGVLSPTLSTISVNIMANIPLPEDVGHTG